MKTRPVYNVLHTPITMAFVERRWIGLSLVAAMIVLICTSWFSAALGTFAIGYGFAFWTRDDPTLLTVLTRAMRTRTHYDAADHRPCRVELQ